MSFYIISVYCVFVVLPRILMHYSGSFSRSLEKRKSFHYHNPSHTFWLVSGIPTSNFLFFFFSFHSFQLSMFFHQSLTKITQAPKTPLNASPRALLLSSRLLSLPHAISRLPAIRRVSIYRTACQTSLLYTVPRPGNSPLEVRRLVFFRGPSSVKIGGCP